MLCLQKFDLFVIKKARFKPIPFREIGDGYEKLKLKVYAKILFNTLSATSATSG